MLKGREWICSILGYFNGAAGLGCCGLFEGYLVSWVGWCDSLMVCGVVFLADDKSSCSKH